MSDETRKDEQEQDEIEAHGRAAVNDEPSDETEDDFEAHRRAASPRIDSPRES